MKIVNGIIPQNVLQLITAGFARKNSEHTEMVVRTAIENWEGAYFAYDPNNQMCLHLPVKPPEGND